MKRNWSPEELARLAWMGDAVLLLYAREKIVREDGRIDDPKCVRMTSNQFLSALGEPTRVEAEIGAIYGESGWAAAVTWIEANLAPLFARQEERRARLAGAKK